MKLYLDRSADELGRPISLIKLDPQKEGEPTIVVGIISRELIRQTAPKINIDALSRRVLNIFRRVFVDAYKESALPVKERTVKLIEYRDVEELINTIFDFSDYSVVADLEAGNYQSKHFDITGEVSDSDLKKVDEWIDMPRGKQPSFSFHIMMNYLCQQGYIDKGEYVMEISW